MANTELKISLNKESVEMLQSLGKDMTKLNKELTEGVTRLAEYKKALDALPWYARLYMLFSKR